MPLRHQPRTRTLRDRPDLSQLKRQAKELLKADAATFALHDAQLVLARSYGFDSWPKLKAYVDGVTVGRLVEAVRAGDISTIRSMLSARPELVDLDVSENDEHRALHHAVLLRQPEIVGLLMHYGADARKGIYPHRDATSPLTIARERGYAEIVEIIRSEEATRSGPAALPEPPVTAALVDAFRRGDEAALIRVFEENPALVHTADPGNGMSALHWAAACLWERFTAWLLARGADPKARAKSGWTPLDLLGSECDSRSPARGQRVIDISRLLLRHGAERTVRWAVATGDGDWLKARHGEGALPEGSRLLTLAVESERPEILRLLLELGLDPDERERVAGLEEVVWSWGSPLRECARAENTVMAGILLEKGADPNTNVYAATAAMHEALERHDQPMVQLLEKHGAIVSATIAASLGLSDRVRQLFEEERAEPLLRDVLSPRESVAPGVLEAAADGGHVELVRMALDHLDWQPGDARWQGMLMRSLGRHDPADRERYLACFRMILDRSGLDIPWRLGRTPLHDVAADWPRSAPMGAEDRLALATILLDKGARLDLRDDLLKSTPLGWACRWGHVELADLLLRRGADPIEADAEPWATARAWAEKMNRRNVLALFP